MELTRDEKVKACGIAVKEVERRIDQFRPDKPVIKNKKGWVCEQIFRGSAGDEMMCSITLQWNYPSAGAIGRITQVIHVRLRCLVKPGGRFLRLVDFHVPEWRNESNSLLCSRCGPGFNAPESIVKDTSLQEY